MMTNLIAALTSANFGKFMVAFTSGFFFTLVSVIQADEPIPFERIIIAVTGAIAVLVTLYTAISNSKNEALRSSQTVIDMLTKQLEIEKTNNAAEIKMMREQHDEDMKRTKEVVDGLGKSIDYEREQRIRSEDYIRTLTRLLADNNIPFPEYPKPPSQSGPSDTGPAGNNGNK